MGTEEWVRLGSPVGGSYGYPSEEGFAFGVAAGGGPSLFWSNAEEFRDLRGDFMTTIIATPLLTFQWDQSTTDNTRKLSIGGPSIGIGGVFHLRTTTPNWTTSDYPVTIPLRQY